MARVDHPKQEQTGVLGIPMQPRLLPERQVTVILQQIIATPEQMVLVVRRAVHQEIQARRVLVLIQAVVAAGQARRTAATVDSQQQVAAAAIPLAVQAARENLSSLTKWIE